MGVCNTCRVPYERAWQVGQRKDVLQRLVGLYKFERARSAYKDLSGLLDAVVPMLPADAIIVPVPTVASHIRERGYDHTALVARDFAHRRGLRYQHVLGRTTTTTQRHATARQRIAQAKVAFAVTGAIVPCVPYVLIDDIVTTGASVVYASKALKDAGASQVWVAIVARQTLD
jgi:ComF family protein